MNPADARDAATVRLLRQLSQDVDLTTARTCLVADVLQGMAADGQDLLVVDWDADGELVQVRRAATYAPRVGDVALVLITAHTPVALCAVVGAPPD